MTPSKIQYVVSVDVYEQAAHLPASEYALLQEAKKAMKNAYAPYSSFSVGAALLLENGAIVSGNNQENAAYPSGMCAERVAIYYAGAQYPLVPIKTICIVCDTHNQHPISPCGACRQAIAEYEQRSKTKIKILMASAFDKVYSANSIEVLLPFMFGAACLKKK
ncbi:MAG: cytidine deaminase [Bacteroidetes bacterium]|nr:cytidine deaminase [Bacteroidota bacterium]